MNYIKESLLKIKKDIESHGVSKDIVLTIENLKPNLILSNIKLNQFTSFYSDVYKDEILLTLEEELKEEKLDKREILLELDRYFNLLRDDVTPPKFTFNVDKTKFYVGDNFIDIMELDLNVIRDEHTDKLDDVFSSTYISRILEDTPFLDFLIERKDLKTFSSIMEFFKGVDIYSITEKELIETIIKTSTKEISLDATKSRLEWYRIPAEDLNTKRFITILRNLD